MKKLRRVIEIKQAGSEQKALPAGKTFGKSQGGYGKPAASQSELSNALDACGKTRSSKVRMIGPCGF